MGLKFFMAIKLSASSYSSTVVISTSMSSATELLLNIALTAIIITANITVVKFNPREDELFIIFLSYDLLGLLLLICTLYEQAQRN